MTKKPPRKGLFVLPGGDLVAATLAEVLPLIPVETWTATDDWAERLPDARLAELVSEYVLHPILTYQAYELDRQAWRKLADVLLTEMIRRTEARQAAALPA